MSQMKKRIWTLGTAAMLVAATAGTGAAQQQGMMRSQMHGDTVPTAAPCPRGMMGGTPMMGMMGRGPGGMMGAYGTSGMMGMMPGTAGDSTGWMPMRGQMGPGMMGSGMGMMGGGAPMMSGPGAMGMGMMGASPSMLLAQRDVLELTDDQVTRLEELQKKQQGMMQGMHTGMMAVRSQMQDAMAADSLDMDAYRKAVEAMADQMVGHQMQMARFREQVLDVLTPEQRDKLQTGMRMMRHMMGGRGMGGGPMR